MFWLSWLSVARADTLVVEADGSGSYTSLWQAIEESNDGDTIVVGPGAYPGPFELGDKTLTIESTDGPAVTTLLPADYPYWLPPVVGVWSDYGTVTLRGFTLEGDQRTGGLVVYGTFVGEDLIFQGSPGSPAHLFAESADISLTDCAFEAKGGDAGQHARVLDSVARFTRVSFRKGHSPGGGGAINLDRSDATFTDCVFADNRAEGSGGAIYARVESYNLVVVTDCVFERNEAYEYGGAMLQEFGSLEMRGTTLRDNYAHSGSGGLDHSFGVSLIVEDSLVVGNGTPGDSAGIGAFYHADALVKRTHFEANVAEGSGGGMTVWVSDLANLEGNTFCSNVAADSGGGIYFDNYDYLEATVRNNVFVANQAAFAGAALSANVAVVEFAQNTVVDSNTAGGIGGETGAVSSSRYSRVSLRNNAFVGNIGGAAYESLDADEGYVGHNLVFANDGNLRNMLAGNLVESEPGFRAYTPGDCRSDLRPDDGSALVDAGDPEVRDDDDSPSDLGAYGGPDATDLRDMDRDGHVLDDCNDDDPALWSGTDEIVADGLDQDCDGLDLCHLDIDRDGVGSETLAPGPLGCAEPGYAPAGGDCDDAAPKLASDCSPPPVDSPPVEEPAKQETLPPPWFCAQAPAGGWPLWPLVLSLAIARAAGRRPR